MTRRPYRHLLAPTDGSRAAQRGAKVAVALARLLGARITALYVAPTNVGLEEGAAALHGARDLIEHIDRHQTQAAQRALDAVKALAKAAGVRCGAESARDDQPSRAMLRVARKRGCDLIVLAPRGPAGLRGLLFGSETARVLSRSRTSVLVVR